MDIYSFINSPDVAAYCREINKVWNPFEMAVIIGRSQRPMADKHAAWRDLMAEYPDMSTPANMHYKSFNSLHQKLMEEIDYKERVFALFKTSEQGAVYTYNVRWRDEDRHLEPVFSSFEAALVDARDSWEHDETHEFIFKRVFIDGEITIEAFTDYNGNPRYVSIYGPNHDEVISGIPNTQIFEDLFFVDIPMPFKRGDILTIRDNPQDDGHVFVLNSLVQDDKELYQKRLDGKMSDGTDLMGWGFFVSDDGVLYGDHTGYQDHFEYYRGKYKGNRRLLHYVSLYLKGERGFNLPELLAMQCRIVAEHQLKSNFLINAHGCYIPEKLLAENQLTPEEKERAKSGKSLMPWVADKLSVHQVEFLLKEFGGDRESVQNGLSDGGGWFMGRCAGIVHDENHYERTSDSRFNNARRAMARMILESYSYTENDWVDKHAEINNNEEEDGSI